MASTTALFSGLAGLNVNARRLEVIGNNISNVNTTSFKSNRILFTSAFNRTFSLGTGPSSLSGGTNPGQVGLGVGIAGTQRSFANGAINATGIDTDLAIEGDGFFIVDRGGEQLFTRAGAFQFNSQNDLVTLSGERLQGYAVDDNFELVTGRLEPVNIPVGTLSVAEATRSVTLSGNLNADGDTATTGSVITLGTFEVAAAPAVGTTLLTALDPPYAFVDGDTLTISGAERGGKVIPDATLNITAATDVDELMEFVRRALGIYDQGGFDIANDPYADDDGSVTIDGTGAVIIAGNRGSFNDLVIDTTNITVDSGGTTSNPFTPDKTVDANGESIRTTFVVYDSLGTEMQIDLTMVLAHKDDDGTYWRPMFHSGDDTDLQNHLENGTLPIAAPWLPVGGEEDLPLLRFDNFGILADTAPIAVSVDRMDTGAQNPMSFELAFTSPGDTVSAYSDTGSSSTLAAVFQDGSPLGTLNSFSVGIDGIVTGGFTNGLTRTIGQVAIGTFRNPEGLVDVGNNLFGVGPNSGTPLVTTPLEFGTGRVVGGALEVSNVDLSAEFINMIQTQTGYSAAARVISTTDQLLQQLLQIGG